MIIEEYVEKAINNGHYLDEIISWIIDSYEFAYSAEKEVDQDSILKEMLSTHSPFLTKIIYDTWNRNDKEEHRILAKKEYERLIAFLKSKRIPIPLDLMKIKKHYIDMNAC